MTADFALAKFLSIRGAHLAETKRCVVNLNLLAKEGERYRMSLERLAADLGMKQHIIFHNRFVSMDDLKEFIGATDI